MVLLYVDYDFNIKQGLYDKNNKICVMIYKYYHNIKIIIIVVDMLYYNISTTIIIYNIYI